VFDLEMGKDKKRVSREILLDDYYAKVIKGNSKTTSIEPRPGEKTLTK
jgi:hypothetical protein